MAHNSGEFRVAIETSLMQKGARFPLLFNNEFDTNYAVWLEHLERHPMLQAFLPTFEEASAKLDFWVTLTRPVNNARFVVERDGVVLRLVLVPLWVLKRDFPPVPVEVVSPKLLALKPKAA